MHRVRILGSPKVDKLPATLVLKNAQGRSVYSVGFRRRDMAFAGLVEKQMPDHHP